jgi:hypothetical protein
MESRAIWLHQLTTYFMNFYKQYYYELQVWQPVKPKQLTACRLLPRINTQVQRILTSYN